MGYDEKMYVPIRPYKKKSVTADSSEELIREYLIIIRQTTYLV